MFAFFDRKILRSVTHFQSRPGVAKHFQANGNDTIFNFNKRVVGGLVDGIKNSRCKKHSL